MTVNDMHTAFKIGLDKSDTLNYPNFSSPEIDIFLNQAQERFIKQRYGISNPKGDSFEETQKRTDDIREVLEDAKISTFTKTTQNKPFGVFAGLPSTAPGNVYWFAINEEIDIAFIDCNSTVVTSGNIVATNYYIVTSGSVVYETVTYNVGEHFVGNGATYTGTGTVKSASLKRVGIRPIQHDDYNKIINDPFNKPYHDQAVRLMFKDKAELITDSDSSVVAYYLRYIRKPLQISLTSSVNSELADHTHQEVVDMAVSLCLENIESVRYQTNLNELVKVE